MSPQREAEQDAEKGKILPKSKQEQDQKTRELQTTKVNELLNKSIPGFTKAVKKFNSICEPVKDNMAQQIDEMLSTEQEKAAYKKTDDQWNSICDLFTDNNATLLFLEQFGSDFRKEWKGKKKESLERRGLFVDGKMDELGKLRKEVMDRVKENLAKVGIAFPDGSDKTDKESGGVLEDKMTREDEDTGAKD